METKKQVKKPTKEEGKKFLENNSHSAWNYYLKQLFSSDTPEFSLLKLSEIYCFYEQLSRYILHCDNNKLSNTIELSQKDNCQYVALHLLSYMYKEHKKLYSNAGIILKEYLLKLSLTTEDKQQNFHLMWSYVALMNLDGIDELKQELKSSLNLEDKKALEKVAYVFMNYNGLGYEAPAAFAQEISDDNPFAALGILYPICKQVRERFEFDTTTNHLPYICRMIVDVVKKIDFSKYPELKVDFSNHPDFKTYRSREKPLHPYIVKIYQHAVISGNRFDEAYKFLDKKLQGVYSDKEFAESLPLLRTIYECGQHEKALKHLCRLYSYAINVLSKSARITYLDLFCDIIATNPEYYLKDGSYLSSSALLFEDLNLKTIALLPYFAKKLEYRAFAKYEEVISNKIVFNLLLSELIKDETLEVPVHVFQYFKELNVPMPEWLKPKHDAFLENKRIENEKYLEKRRQEQEENNKDNEQKEQKEAAKKAVADRHKELIGFFEQSSKAEN